MDLLRRAFRDISAGHSRGQILGRATFIRHLSYAHQIEFDSQRDYFMGVAKGMGILTDEERLAVLRADGKWDDARERELKRAEQYVVDLEAGMRKNAHMPSMVTSYVKQIETAKKEAADKAREKRVLMGLTCEVYADREVNDYYILMNLFGDDGLTQPLFADSEFDYLSEPEVDQIVGEYNKVIEGCSPRNIKRLAMQPFFQHYFQLCGDDYTTMFGRPICALTFYQVDLLRNGAQFRHIYSSNDVTTFPKHVLEDPDLLIDYTNAAAKKREELAQQGAFEEGTMVVGMKKEDAKAVGVKAANPMGQIMSKFGGNVMEWAAKGGR